MSAVGPVSNSPESAAFLVFIDGAFAFRPAAARVDECWLQRRGGCRFECLSKTRSIIELLKVRLL